MSDWANQAENEYQKQADEGEKVQEWIADNVAWLFDGWVTAKRYNSKGHDCLVEWVDTVKRLPDDQTVDYEAMSRQDKEAFQAWALEQTAWEKEFRQWAEEEYYA